MALHIAIKILKTKGGNAITTGCCVQMNWK